MWFYIQTWLPLLTIALTAASFIMGQATPQASNVRDALETIGNAFTVKAVELDIKLQKLANDNSTASCPARARRMDKLHFDRTTIQV